MDSALLHIHHVGIIADGFDTYFEFHKKLAELLKRPSTKSLKTHADEAVAAITSEVRRFVPDAGSAGDSPKEVVLRLLYGVDELITAMTHGGHGLTDDEKKAREREAAAKVAVAAYLAQQAVNEGGGSGIDTGDIDIDIHHVGIIADGFDTYFEFHKRLKELLERSGTKSLKTQADDAVAAITSDVRGYARAAGAAGDSPKAVVLRLLHEVDELITDMSHTHAGPTDDDPEAGQREAAAKVAVAAYLAQQAVTEGGG